MNDEGLLSCYLHPTSTSRLPSHLGHCQLSAWLLGHSWQKVSFCKQEVSGRSLQKKAVMRSTAAFTTQMEFPLSLQPCSVCFCHCKEYLCSIIVYGSLQSFYYEQWKLQPQLLHSHQSIQGDWKYVFRRESAWKVMLSSHFIGQYLNRGLLLKFHCAMFLKL